MERIDVGKSGKAQAGREGPQGQRNAAEERAAGAGETRTGGEVPRLSM